MQGIENEIEDENNDSFDCELEDDKNQNEKNINENIDNAKNNSDENLNKNIKNILEELNEYSEDFVIETVKFCKELKFNENPEGMILIKKIINDAYNYSSINLKQRLLNFFEFISKQNDLKFENISDSINIIKLEKIKNKTNEDIIYFWKEYLTEDFLNKKNLLNQNTNLTKDTIKILLQDNYEITEIYNIFLGFKTFFNEKKFSQYEIINSLISIVIAYEIKELDDELKEIIDNKKYYIKDKYNSFEVDPKIVLDFYLKASERGNPKKLTIPELLHRLKNMNSSLSDIIIKQREEQLKKIHMTINNQKYINYKKDDFQKWTQKEYPKLLFDEKNFNESTAQVLGMISLVIFKEKEYHLRDAQLIAILMFIGKDKEYGMIEEISTGEGKSCIICSLSIYYALKKKKVDVISSSNSLAERDSNHFAQIYDYFNLTTSYPKYSKSFPYKSDILYGTFFEFEGDYLREIIKERNIRNNRPYEVIIIDEVDNLFIDNILSSTRLSDSSKGFKFLIPIYLSTYLSFELYDYLFLLFFSINLKNVDSEKKKKFEKLMKDPEYRKNTIINITKSLLQNAINENEVEEVIQNNINLEDNKKVFEVVKENCESFFTKLKEHLEYPDFLISFVQTQMSYWINSAFEAKNLMNEEVDYVITEAKRDISPVDRTNTGETELSTVYSDGLHQMLEIKHKLRIKDETLTDTFLSHISFFKKYKNDKEFLFFGLTGTIGDPETQKIYHTDYFKSKLLFIPQYKKKRFIELPPILSDITGHYNDICKDIIINYSKGRKILVICESIKEARDIEKRLKYFPTQKIKEEYPNQNIKEDFNEQILLYTRSDTNEKNNINKKQKIILSTNFGGRGTDIKTTNEEEENGGLHVILTSMPSNYRVLKQAFGRTSREGKKGSGQMIIKKLEGYNNYSELIKEMNSAEMKRIQRIKFKLKKTLFKDELFIQFCEIINDIDQNSCFFDDIRERWAIFLKDNVTRYESQDFDESKIKKKFNLFIKEIKELKWKKGYEKFNNPFLKISEGLRIYKNFEPELNNYLDVDIKMKRFFFTFPYIKAIVLIVNQKKYNEEFFNNALLYLNEAKKDIELLSEKSINPILSSFSQWDDVINNFKVVINEDMPNNINEKEEDIDEQKNFENDDLYKQYNNIKKILIKIYKKINENINFIEKNRSFLKKNENFYIHITKKDLTDGLDLEYEEQKELDFFYDASFYNVFEFSLMFNIEKIGFFFKFFYWLFASILIIPVLSLLMVGLCIGGILIGGYLAGKALLTKIGIIKRRRNIEMEENSIFSNIFSIISGFFKGPNYEENYRNVNAEYKNENQNDRITTQSLKNDLLTGIYQNVEEKFTKIKELDIVKFLIFVDFYLSNQFWDQKISNLFEENFRKIFIFEFNENIEYFKEKITKKNLDEKKKKYNLIYNEFWEKCIEECSNLKNFKNFNEKTGINSLEHLLRTINPDKINEEIINQTFKQILQYQIISKDGYANKILFNDCFDNKDEENLKQTFPFNITTKFDGEKLKKISKLKHFRIQGFEIPIIDASFIDLRVFYKNNKYNVKEQLEKDYTLVIINNIKEILKKMLSINSKTFDLIYKRYLDQIKSLIKKLLEEKVFSQSNLRNVEKELAFNLTEEEKNEFNNLIKQAEQNIKALSNKK